MDEDEGTVELRIPQAIDINVRNCKAETYERTIKDANVSYLFVYQPLSFVPSSVCAALVARGLECFHVGEWECSCGTETVPRIALSCSGVWN